jgi:formylglycine-generating enzyme required for sulfatase activity
MKMSTIRAIVVVAFMTRVISCGTPANAQTFEPLRGPSVQVAIADLKAKSAVLVAAAVRALDSLTPPERRSAPPVIWKVPNAIHALKDCEDCPVMVAIPAGEFTMGAPPTEAPGALQHRVRLSEPFAVSRFEITFEEWDRCVADDGCGGYRPGDEGWGRGQRPVMNISWVDAKAYVEWLSRKTGKRYRLLSEAEWEYAARAGTSTPYNTGESISPDQANYDASTDGSGPSDRNRQKTLTVGQFPPNGFGLYDMHGNVSEWVEDCWFDDYTERRPTDGSPSPEGDCKGHVVRGGSWEDSDTELRAAARTGGDKDDRFYTDGLRIARDL